MARAGESTLTANEVDTLRRLERLPMSWVQGRLLLMGGLGYTADGICAGILAFILPPVALLFGLTNTQVGLLGSSVLIGFLFGAFFAGTLGDLVGRRRVMMYALAIFCIASLFAASARSWEFLFWARVATGIGIGAESAIVAPFLSEFIQGKYRGRFVGSLAGFISIGWVLAALLGYLIVPASSQGWRIVQVITALPIVVLLWWRRALPESPRWLMQQGRSTEAAQVVAAMEEEVVRRRRQPLPPLETIEIPQVAMRRGGFFLKNLAGLWSRSQVKNTVMLWILWVAITFSFYGFFNWIPSLLVKQGLTITKSFGYSMIIYLAQVPGYYSAAFLSEKLDRKWTIITYMVGGGIFALLMASFRAASTVTVFGFFLSFFMNGTYAVLYTYTPEVYPTAFRATGSGVASAVGRLGGIAAPIMIGFLYTRIGFGGVFSITTGVLLFGALVVAVVGISTTGKTLEEITAEEVGHGRSG
jgi:putative MFS transporter